jgi:hypothetical protein
MYTAQQHSGTTAALHYQIAAMISAQETATEFQNERFGELEGK